MMVEDQETQDLLDEVTIREIASDLGCVDTSDNLLDGVEVGKSSKPDECETDENETQKNMDVDSICKKARELASELPSETAQGLQDMHKLTLAIGMPMTRILFSDMINSGSGTPEAKIKLLKEVKTETKTEGLGCIQVEFTDKQTGTARTAYMLLDTCGADHDLGAELDKIYSHIAVDKQEEIKKHMSMILFLGRTIFSQMMVSSANLVRKIAKKLPQDFKANNITIDSDNTTLFLGPPCSMRVGLFIRLDTDVCSE
jgi:hypothetical protein